MHVIPATIAIRTQAAREIRSILATHGVRLGSPRNPIKLPDGSPLTMADLIDRRLAREFRAVQLAAFGHPDHAAAARRARDTAARTCAITDATTGYHG